MSAARIAKPPKLKVDEKYGGDNIEGKYKTKEDLRRFHRSFWWLKGYDVKVVHESDTEIRLGCADKGSCRYDVLGRYMNFPNIGSGWGLVPEFFNPEHNHDKVYIPMDRAVEDARRSKLAHDDPSLEKPPLVPISSVMAGSQSSSGGGPGGFAGTPSVQGSAFGVGGGGAGSTLGLNGISGTPPSASGGLQTPVMGQQGTGLPGVGQQPPASAFQQQQAPAFQQQQQQQQFQQPPPPQFQQPQPQPQYGQPRPVPTFQQPSPAGAAYQPSPNEPLAAFLLSISPAFTPYLAAWPLDLPLSTPPSDIVDLDDADDPSDRTVFNVFKDNVPALPPFLVALAADGVRKAGKRRAKGRNEGTWHEGVSQLDGRIGVGLEKARAEKWVRGQINRGLDIIAQQQGPQAVQGVPRL